MNGSFVEHRREARQCRGLCSLSERKGTDDGTRQQYPVPAHHRNDSSLSPSPAGALKPDSHVLPKGPGHTVVYQPAPLHTHTPFLTNSHSWDFLDYGHAKKEVLLFLFLKVLTTVIIMLRLLKVHTKSNSLIKILSRSFHDTSISRSSSGRERQNEPAASWPGVQDVGPGSAGAPSAEARVPAAPEWT